MRIAHVIDIPGSLGGGIKQHILNLAVTQKARGDSPIVVAPEPGGFTAACGERDIPVAIETCVGGGEMRDNLPIDILCALFTSLNVEVIHCHTPQSAVKAITAGNKIGIPCVYTNHVQKGFRRDTVDSLEFTVISVCRSAFEHLKKQGFPGERIFYVPNGTKAVPRVVSGSPPTNLIWVGRLESVKGPDIAILAMADLKRRRGTDCPILNVYGTGSLEAYLKEMVSVLCLSDTVRFHGLHVGILERCPATDILVLSSRAETGPLVALEAMSRGMPIVATRVGEIEDMIPDRRYGYITLTESIRSLTDGIESMLSDVRAGRFDPDLPISRHRALYMIEKMAERIDAVYKRLLTK